MEVPEDRKVEEKATVVPLMSNCWDWARMAPPRTTLIWNPMPVGQPEGGASTMVELSAVTTFSFRVMLTLGYDPCNWAKATVREWRYLSLAGDAIKTDHVSQDERKAGRVGGDGSPSDRLTLFARVPGGILARASDSGSPSAEGKKDDCGKYGKGAHF